jgi:nucleoid-associated protein YgaU
MGLETRIGVVVGLVIVVVASVYFFYGSSHEVDEVFLPATPRIAAAPKIPPGGGQPLAPSRSLVDRVQVPRRDVLRPAVMPGTTIATPPSSVDQGATARQTPSTGSLPAVASADRQRSALPDTRTTTPLRTSPSDELVGATWDNLTKSNKPVGTPASPVAGTSTSGTPNAAAQPVQSAGSLKPSTASPTQRLHRVKPGDTLSGIAKEYLGPTGKSDAILKVNPQLRRGRALKIGEMLFIPEGGSAVAAVAPKPEPSAPQAATAATYRVAEGDSFYSIARDVYGDSARWGELYRLNRAVVKGDPKRLKVGMVLKLPPK